MSWKKAIQRKRRMTLTTLSMYQNAAHYKEKENAFIKNYKCGIFSLVFVIKPGGRITEIFSVGPQKTEKGLKA